MNPGWREKLALRVKKALGLNIFLCDSCEWDWDRACRNSARPNATWCLDYKKKGR